MANGLAVSSGHGHPAPDAAVLVVEDDSALRDVLARALREEGHRVLTAVDGRSAMATADERTAVVILDIGLPDSDGRDVCQALRARGIGAAVIFLTAKDALHDRLAGFAAGGDDYLSKPFHVSELVARVRAAMKRHEQRRPTADDCGLMLDPATFCLRCGAQSVAVSPIEFRLLGRLLSHTNQVVRRRELLRAGWPEGAIVHENTLDQYVARIRRKLAAIGAENKVETVRGIGYRMRP